MLEDVSEGISINGKGLDNIWYADDTVIMAGSLKGLRQLKTRLKDVSGESIEKFLAQECQDVVFSKNERTDPCSSEESRDIQKDC
ncbi:hypothetical protein Trydic_g19035 [Trypoxylus dichotomus]